MKHQSMRRPHPLPTVEQQHPWLRWAYVAIVALSCLASAFYPAGFAPF
jgi:hypothetical protein